MPADNRGGPARPSMRRIVVSLLKGGVAKSETAVHLAHGLALKGYRVLLVDTDVQAQCSDMLGLAPGRGLAQVITGLCPPLEALDQARENLWLLAGGTDLAAVKMEIARREMAPEAVLADALERYEGGFDVMIMDTAPGWDTLLVNALYASRYVLSPVSMEPMALTGLMRFEERLAVIQKYNRELKLRWVVPTFVDGRVKKTGEIMRQLEERYGELLAPPIRYAVKLSEATAFGQTIFEHDPKGPGAKAYQALVDQVAADVLEAPALSRIVAESVVDLERPAAPLKRAVAEPRVEPPSLAIQLVEAASPAVAAAALPGRGEALPRVPHPDAAEASPPPPSAGVASPGGARRLSLKSRLAGAAPEAQDAAGAGEGYSDSFLDQLKRRFKDGRA